MEHSTILPIPHSHECPFNHLTGEENRAAALERLTSREPTEDWFSADFKAARRRLRRAGGRCGGQFVVEWDGNRPIYRYVLTDPKERFIDRLVVWANRRSTDTSSNYTDDNEQNSFVPISERGARRHGQAIQTKTTDSDVNSIRSSTPSAMSDGYAAAFEAVRKMNRKFSTWLLKGRGNHQDYDHMQSKEFAEDGIFSGSTTTRFEHDSSRTPVKEQMAPEDDRASKHEEINKDFFDPPQRKKKSFSRLRTRSQQRPPSVDVFYRVQCRLGGKHAT